VGVPGIEPYMDARGRCDVVFCVDRGGCARGFGPGRVGNAEVDCCCRNVGMVVEEAGVLLVAKAEGGLRPNADGGRRPDVLLPIPSGDGCPK
jgi:hypothetical protein